jgi:Fic family protein
MRLLASSVESVANDESERHSRPGTAVPLPALTEEERAAIEARNGLRQFDRMVELIDQCTGRGPRFRMRPSTIMELNRLAVESLVEAAGAWRQVPIEISTSSHAPPGHLDVPREIDEMCEYVQAYWSDRTPIHLSSYVMWRLNWIHPFVDGNGRTSRIMSYLVLCAKLGYRLPGTRTIPERIAENKKPYYAALESADVAWKEGRIDVSAMEDLLQEHLEAQLRDIQIQATSGHRDDVE